MRLSIFIIPLAFLFSCGNSTKSLEDVKKEYGDFGESTIKWVPLDYTKTPVNKQIEHHPEEYTYLNQVDFFRIAHLSDGLFITGLMVAPKEPGSYPVLVFNRGGNQDLGSLIVADAVNVMAPFAAAGYVVVATNYRGNSSAEGVEEFGGVDVNDLRNLISSLKELPNADPTRVGLLGISRGGMMNYLTVKGDSLSPVKAIANIGGITDLETTIKHHPEIGVVAEELIPDFATDRKQAVESRSAVYWTADLPKAPLLILHSEEDQHVNFEQIPPFCDSLEANNQPYKLVQFKNDKHGLLNHQQEVRKLILDWFDKYVKNGEPFSQVERRVVID